jgi:hypothetical protein
MNVLILRSFLRDAFCGRGRRCWSGVEEQGEVEEQGAVCLEVGPPHKSVHQLQIRLPYKFFILAS